MSFFWQRIQATIPRRTDKLSVGIPFNGSRRWYISQHGEAGLYTLDYALRTQNRMFDVLAMLLGSGVQAIYSPLVGHDLESRGAEYVALIRQAVTLLTGETVRDWCQRHRANVALYGDLEALDQVGVNVDAQLRAFMPPREATAYLRFGFFADQTPARIVQRVAETGTSFLDYYYSGAAWPLDIWVGCDQPTFFDVPFLLAGRTALYFLQFPTFYLTPRLWRRILCDWLFVRGDEENLEALPLPGSRRLILGLGRRREGRWSLR